MDKDITCFLSKGEREYIYNLIKRNYEESKKGTSNIFSKFLGVEEKETERIRRYKIKKKVKSSIYCLWLVYLSGILDLSKSFEDNIKEILEQHFTNMEVKEPIEFVERYLEKKGL